MDSDAIVRAAGPDDCEALLTVISKAFGLDRESARPLYFNDPYFDLTHKRLLSLAGVGPVSCLTVIPADIRVGNAFVRVAGIAGVATLPAYRRRGYAARLLYRTLEDLHTDLHYSLTVLNTTEPAYYRKLGWETVSVPCAWTVSAADLPRSGGAADIRVVRPDDEDSWAAIAALHREAAGGRTGDCRRDERRWRIIRTMTPGRLALTALEAGAITGYTLLDRVSQPGLPDVVSIVEIAGRTQNACDDLLGFLRDRLPTDTTIRRQAAGAMARIVDLADALQAVHRENYAPVLSERNAVLTIRATDRVREANERPISLGAFGIVTGETDGSGVIECEIGCLSQLYMGYCSASEACREGRLTASSHDALALADSLFPNRKPRFSAADHF